MSASSSCSDGGLSPGEILGPVLDRRDGGVFDVVPLLGASLLETLPGSSLWRSSGAHAVQGEALGAMYDIIDESKTKLFLGSIKSRHLPPASWVDGALAREVVVGAAAIFGGDRRCSRHGGDA